MSTISFMRLKETVADKLIIEQARGKSIMYQEKFDMGRFEFQCIFLWKTFSFLNNAISVDKNTLNIQNIFVRIVWYFIKFYKRFTLHNSCNSFKCAFYLITKIPHCAQKRKTWKLLCYFGSLHFIYAAFERNVVSYSQSNYLHKIVKQFFL